MIQPSPLALTGITRQWSEFYTRPHPRSARWGQVSVPGKSGSPDPRGNGQGPPGLGSVAPAGGHRRGRSTESCKSSGLRS